ncbi:hypothetical protein NLM33_19525 [Bradyrhizobium sp. CCGUVB1N3]|uniref:hypothetical protein n=1 Tax=Bradyrhizobium sp. CCGUVB1N3 TaxID=2949629 RepID=UPI0020B430F0|nr:hypothetical protein [Bradyrhizobium sp. CCGUVB1N3]MCP3472506.1 hypothetical protein [Bradyrhizobium sp. CCGUVB1N3]
MTWAYRSMLAILFSLMPAMSVLYLAVRSHGYSSETAYGAARDFPDEILMWAWGAVAAYLIYRAYRINSRRDIVRMGAILLSSVLLLFLADQAIHFYLKDYLQLFDGSGG